jgi:beta-phosphoglucomutase
MIKLIIFDLDGVLVEAKDIHFDALNKALGDYAISWNEHLSTYDGLKTAQKLDMLTKEKGLPADEHQRIWEDKQKYTLQMLVN